MKLLRGILLLCSVVMLVLTWAFPFFTYPVGEYKGSTKNVLVEGETIKYSVKFNTDGTCKLSLGDSIEGDFYYKVKDKRVYYSAIKDFEIDERTTSYLIMDSMYSLSSPNVNVSLINKWGIIFTGIYGLIALASLVTLTFRKR